MNKTNFLSSKSYSARSISAVFIKSCPVLKPETALNCTDMQLFVRYYIVVRDELCAKLHSNTRARTPTTSLTVEFTGVICTLLSLVQDKQRTRHCGRHVAGRPSCYSNVYFSCVHGCTSVFMVGKAAYVGSSECWSTH